MWAAVKSRLHTPTKIFPFGEGADEVMLHGTVAYELKDGRRAEVSSVSSICSRQSEELGSPEISRILRGIKVLMFVRYRSSGLRERVWCKRRGGGKCDFIKSIW